MTDGDTNEDVIGNLKGAGNSSLMTDPDDTKNTERFILIFQHQRGNPLLIANIFFRDRFFGTIQISSVP